MIKILFFVFALFLSITNVNAEWILVGESEDRLFYVDPSSFKKKNHIVKMWGVDNLKAPLTKIQSIKHLGEYDCDDDTMRIVSTYGFSETFGKGKLIGSSDDSTKFIPILPESTQEVMWKIACNKLKK